MDAIKDLWTKGWDLMASSGGKGWWNGRFDLISSPLESPAARRTRTAGMDTGITLGFPHHKEMTKGMSKHDDMSSRWWKKEAECQFGEADGHGAAQVRHMIYLHHHLLPSQRLAVRCVGRHVGPLQLQCDIATLLLEGSGQLLEARLLFFHRGQDAGGRANIIVLHVWGWLQRYGSSHTGSEGREKGGGGGGGIGSLETPWPSRMGINRLTHASSSTKFGFVEMGGDFSNSTGWYCRHQDCRDATPRVEYTGWVGS